MTDPSLTQNVGGQSVQAGEVFGKFSILLFLLPVPADSDFLILFSLV